MAVYTKLKQSAWPRGSPFTQEVEGSTPTGGTCPNIFSEPVDQNIRSQCALSWKIVVSEWRSVIAVSLNVGGGVRLIKSAKLHVHANQYKRDKDGRMTSGVRGRGCVPRAIRGTSLREFDYIHTYTHIYTQFQSISKHHICTQN